MKSQETIDAIVKVAQACGLEPAALLAICHVESAGRVFARVGGRLEPLIRFEGHYFDRRLSAAKKKRARASGLASPKAGTVANPRSQKQRWVLLERAERIDKQAARESVSWGLGQVMGAHWAWLGYGSVDGLVAEARSGAGGQARLMVRYINKAGLAPAIASHDWEAFARGYNGPAYKKHRYDTRIAAAYRRYRKLDLPKPPANDGVADLCFGAKGPGVADLQRKLINLGYPLAIDGVFGPATRTAVRRFQKQSGLAVSGVADTMTMGVINKDGPASGRRRPFFGWLGNLVWLLRGRG